MRFFVIAALIANFAFAHSQPAQAQTRAAVIYVSPRGDDAASGTRATPLRTIQSAVDRATRGTSIELTAGSYVENVVIPISQSGITLRGPRTAVLHGTGKGRVLWIQASNVTLTGFSIDGLMPGADPALRESYADVGILLQTITEGSPTRSVKVVLMRIGNLRGECVRIKDLAEDIVISANTITHCGKDDFVFGGGGKNGEGIYIGTAPEQIAEKNTHQQPDVTRRVLVRGNTILTHGNECVDIKEAARENIVERNLCGEQLDPNSGGFDARGDANIFRDNVIRNVAGAGIRFGGDTDLDGVDNIATGNTIIRAGRGGIRYQRAPQGRQCGNRVFGDAPAASGDFAANFAPDGACQAASPTE
jgi:hypothetical protein